LPGGEAAIHEPWRVAASICGQLDTSVDLRRWPGWKVTPQQFDSLALIVNRPQFSPITSSAGRLIDAVAALVLGIDHVDFDGQAAMRLEAAADHDATGWYDFPLSEGELPELDWRPTIAGILADVNRGTNASIIAMRFHRTLARGIIHICRLWNALPVVLGGGVFQNRLLTELVAGVHDDASQLLGLPGVIPPNDGGLAAGQLAIAAAKGDCTPCA
jgi:hydrogenase maturation protein HypF